MIRYDFIDIPRKEINQEGIEWVYYSLKPIYLGKYPSSKKNPIKGFANYPSIREINGEKIYGELYYNSPLDDHKLQEYYLRRA